MKCQKKIHIPDLRQTVECENAAKFLIKRNAFVEWEYRCEEHAQDGIRRVELIGATKQGKEGEDEP